jgi:hypothetical protein
MMDLMNGFELYDKGTVFTEDQLLSLTYIRTLIANIAIGSRVGTVVPINGFENTTDDVNQGTGTLGDKYINSKPIPSGTVYVKGALCDYSTIEALEGVTLNFIPYFQNGTKWATRKYDGTIRGFSVRIGTKFGLPPEDKTQSYPVYLMFDSYTEFKNIAVLSPEFEFSDVKDYTPLGLDLTLVTAYTAGEVKVNVSKRCSSTPVLGLTEASNFPIFTSNGAPVVATTLVVENGQGDYTLTIKAASGGTAVNLTALQYADVQAQDDDGTYVTKLSNTLNIKGDG